MEVLSARRGEELEAIQHRLHDVWLQLPETIATGTVRLEGLDERSSRVPIRSLGPLAEFERRKARVILVIEHVVAAEMVDRAEIGSLNLAKVWFDVDKSTVHIEGHIPVELRLQVEQLSVRAEITDDTVSSGRAWGRRPRTA